MPNLKSNTREITEGQARFAAREFLIGALLGVGTEDERADYDSGTVSVAYQTHEYLRISAIERALAEKECRIIDGIVERVTARRVPMLQAAE